MRDEAQRRGIRPEHRRRRLFVAAALLVATLAAMIALALVLMPTSQGADGTPIARALPSWFGAHAPSDGQQAPVVQAVTLMDVSPDTAKQMNAAIPYAPGPVPAARRFTYPGSPENRAAARVCLAGAVLYEAGNDPIGQYAVAQVVANRVRHPAFPKTICGVVFQGAERSTGCQFTFACDGALQRHPSAAAWQAALASADAALSGFVFTPVGTATHYHADWLVPYWQSSLTKLVAIHTHIFYRWKDWWGTTPAFTGTITGDEHVDPRLLAAIAGIDPGAASLPAPLPTAAPEGSGTAPVAATAGALLPPAASAANDPVSLRVPGVPAGLFKGNIVRFVDATGSTVVLQLDAKAYSGSFAVLANAICADKPECLVAGFVDGAAIPPGMPHGDGLERADFVFRRKGTDLPQMTWNCALFPRPAAKQCRPD